MVSAHILTADGDVRDKAAELLDRLVADGRMTGDLPDIDQQDDSTVIVIDPEYADLVEEFERIGFTRTQDEDSI